MPRSSDRRSGSESGRGVSSEPALRVAGVLRDAYPDADCALAHRDAFELLVATILSAQCTDERVNRVTPALFARFPDASAMARATPEELEPHVHPTGFFRAKARNLVAMARGLVERHGGAVPTDPACLTALPGVGRKTANVVLGVAFGIASGVVVDTHVRRLSQRLGLTTDDDPDAIADQLARRLPPEEWIAFGHRMIAHGRAVCQARKPACAACPLRELCPRVGVAG